MKPRKQSSVDGVVQRTRSRRLGDFNNPQPIKANPDQDNEIAVDVRDRVKKFENTQVGFDTSEEVTERPQRSIMFDSMSDIPDEDESSIGKKKGWRAKRKAKKALKRQKRAKQRKAWRIFKRLALVTTLSMVVLAGVIGLKSWLALQSIIDRNGEGAVALQDNIDPSSLNGEGDGRVNIMLLGIGGEDHQAGNLADSIIVASIDPFANELAMLSIPRDLYVQVPGFWSTKINEAHAIGEDQDYPGGGVALMRETLEEILDISIHYYVRVDFTGFTDAVDTVGGIEVVLDEPVYDPNFDWQFGVNALNLPAGPNKLDGQTALLLARARGASGIGLGVSRGDFGRGDRQREMLIALKDKVLSIGTYANPLKIAGLIDTAGNHVRTDLDISEMLRVYELVQNISNDKIVSFGLDNGPDNYLVSQPIGELSALAPRGGDFTEIQEFVRELFVDGFIRQEAATIDVLNGTLIFGLAGDVSTELATYGYSIITVAQAPTNNYTETVIYDQSDGQKQFTKALLEQRFGVSMLPSSQIPSTIISDSDFIIIVGQNGTEE